MTRDEYEELVTRAAEEAAKVCVGCGGEKLPEQRLCDECVVEVNSKTK